MWRFMRRAGVGLLSVFFCLGSASFAHAAPPQNTPDDTRCFPIKTIELSGIDSLCEGERAELIKHYIGQWLGVPQLNAVLKVNTDRYLVKGLVTSRAYLPQQDLSSGNLKIQVVEGKVGDLKGAEGSDINDLQLAMSFPGKSGELLKLREIAQMELAPGNTAGGSDAVVKNTPKKPWRVGLSRHNGGQRSTDEKQFASGFYL